eukprot:1161567-Pelagomonas_calceolata.AAC.7
MNRDAKPTTAHAPVQAFRAHCLNQAVATGVEVAIGSVCRALLGSAVILRPNLTTAILCPEMN